MCGHRCPPLDGPDEEPVEGALPDCGPEGGALDEGDPEGGEVDDGDPEEGPPDGVLPLFVVCAVGIAFDTAVPLVVAPDTAAVMPRDVPKAAALKSPPTNKVFVVRVFTDLSFSMTSLDDGAQ